MGEYCLSTWTFLNKNTTVQGDCDEKRIWHASCGFQMRAKYRKSHRLWVLIHQHYHDRSFLYRYVSDQRNEHVGEPLRRFLRVCMRNLERVPPHSGWYVRLWNVFVRSRASSNAVARCVFLWTHTSVVATAHFQPTDPLRTTSNWSEIFVLRFVLKSLNLSL